MNYLLSFTRNSNVRYNFNNIPTIIENSSQNYKIKRLLFPDIPYIKSVSHFSLPSVSFFWPRCITLGLKQRRPRFESNRFSQTLFSSNPTRSMA